MGVIDSILGMFGGGPKKKATDPEVHVQNAALMAQFLSEHVGEVYSHISFNMIDTDDPLSMIILKPTKNRDYYLVVTSGVSALPMVNGNGEEHFSEFVLALPKTWNPPKDEDHFTTLSPEDKFPLGLLLKLSEVPRLDGLQFGFGHTLDTGQLGGSGFSRVMFHFTLLDELGLEIVPDAVDGVKVIAFLKVYPITEEEFEFKNQHDSDELLDKLSDSKKGALFDLTRKTVV